MPSAAISGVGAAAFWRERPYSANGDVFREWHSVSAEALAYNASHMADILMIYIPGATTGKC